MEEENKKEEIIQETSQAPPKEEISSEKTEELIKELLEEEKESLSQEIKPKKIETKKILFYLGFFFLVLIFLGGILVLTNLFQGNKKEITELSRGSLEERKEERERVSQNATAEVQVKREFAFNPPPKTTKTYPFKLELHNFLFPLDDKTFLKVDIYLYFEKSEDYKKAREEEMLLREFFLNEINKKKDPMFWKDTEKVRAYENYLIEAIKKGTFSFTPDKIELEGILLRV